MTLLKKISGIRGTIGGKSGESLSPIDVVEMTAAFAKLIQKDAETHIIVVGRDARISGDIVSQLSINTLRSMGFDVIDLGLSTTPTVEMAVVREKADGGIIFTASHNPKEWNALKLLNKKGEFISEQDGHLMLEIANEKSFHFAPVDKLGKLISKHNAIALHIDDILKLKIFDVSLIKSKAYKVVVDCINSTGSISIPPLLERLGCQYQLINAEMSGQFAHNPEPLPVNLKQLSDKVVEMNVDIGIAVDPDVDRLVIICEDGSMFGEEYTIVAASDFVLSKQLGSTVTNMSSSRAMQDIAESYGQTHYSSAVGEAHVVSKMKEVNAVIGGEGNGGVIYPELHYGRDALVGIVMILNLLAERDITLCNLKAKYPEYIIIKEKFDIDPNKDISSMLDRVKEKYSEYRINEEDGIRIDFDNAWVHLRKSNTEPVLRLIAEAPTRDVADKIIEEINHLIN